MLLLIHKLVDEVNILSSIISEVVVDNNFIVNSYRKFKEKYIIQ